MTLSSDLLHRAIPRASAEAIARHLVSLDDGMDRWEITTPARIAAFLAQIGHESADLERTEENLNYSAEGLRKTWPARFPSIESARQYARKPEAIANYVYASRMGNRDATSGDGWRHRGMGLIQLTGRLTHLAYLTASGLGIEDAGRLMVPPHAALSACWFWGTRGLNALADAGAFEGIVRRINGGLHGLDDRRARWRVAKAAVVDVG